MMDIGVIFAATIVAIGIGLILLGTNKFKRWRNMRRQK